VKDFSSKTIDYYFAKINNSTNVMSARFAGAAYKGQGISAEYQEIEVDEEAKAFFPS
jgi:hypothetical protein